MGGPRQRGWAPVGLRSCFLSGLLGRMGGPRRRGWAPFMFPFWAPGSDARSWAPIGLPSYFLSGRLVPLGSLHISFLGSWVGWVSRGQEAGLPLSSLHVSFFLGSWVGWVDRGQEAGLALGSLHIAWVGRGDGSGFSLGSLHVSFLPGPGSDGWAAAKKLGSHWAPFIFPFWAPGSDGWSAALPLGSLHASFFLGSWVGWVGRSDGVGLPLGSFHISFLGSGVGWVSRGQAAGLPLFSLHVSFFLGSWVGWVGRGQEAGLALGSLHIAILGVGWVGRGQEAGLPLRSLHVSFFLGPGSDGRAAAKKLGSHWAPFIFPKLYGLGFSLQKKVVRRWLDGWAAATGLGSYWAPLMFLGSWRVPFPGSDGWAAATGWALPLRSLHQWAPFMFPFWAPFLFHWAPFMFPFWAPRRLPSSMGSLHVSFLDSFPVWGWPLGSLHVSFLECWVVWAPFMFRFSAPFMFHFWVGWVGRGDGAGLTLGSLPFRFPFWAHKIGWVVLGRMGGPRRRGGLPSCFPYCLNIHFAASQLLLQFWNQLYVQKRKGRGWCMSS